MSPLDSSSVDDDEPQALVEEPEEEEAAEAATPSRGGVVIEKPPANMYTAMLVVSFIAIVLGIICLSLELGRYDWKILPR